jgi:phosphonate transport system substrate-binding protein
MKSGKATLQTAYIIAAGLVVLVGLTIIFYAIAMDIEREMPLPSDSVTAKTDAGSKPVVMIGVISRYPPTIMYRGYQPIMDYLTSQTAYRFELLLSRDYNEALHSLITNKVSAVFLGSYLYVKAHERHPVIPILMPLNETLKPVSRSVLFVRNNSPISSPKDLKGKKLALPSTESFSSQWVLEYELARDGLTKDSLAEVHHFSHHHTVIAQVLNGTYDAGVTREYLLKGLLNHGFRAVVYSVPIPSSPIATTQNSDPAIIAAIKTALLAVNKDETQRAIVTRDWDGEFVYGFVEATDADYDIVRSVIDGYNHVQPK